jgi:hypothetical protein
MIYKLNEKAEEILYEMIILKLSEIGYIQSKTPEISQRQSEVVLN